METYNNYWLIKTLKAMQYRIIINRMISNLYFSFINIKVFI